MLSKCFFLNFDVINTDARVCVGMKKLKALRYNWQVLVLPEGMFHC